MTRNATQLPKSAPAVAACVFLLAFLASLLPQVANSHAYAVEVEVTQAESEAVKTAYELQQQIEAAQVDYAAAREEVEAAYAAVEENRAKITELENQIPAQQERSANAARDLYKIQQQGVGLIDLLLSADSMGTFLKELEYIDQVTDANIQELNRLADLKAEIDAAGVELEEKLAEANAHASDAEDAIRQLEEAQAEVQRRIEEEARQAAEIAARAAEQEANPRANDQVATSGDSGDTDTGSSDSGASGSSESQAEATPVSAPAASSDEEAFISEWAPRIDAYLSGSPLAGQGATFARAAYTYNVDPRWSPAISFTESSKGAVCFKSHNAWGWGSSSWGSWEEAIDAHVRGLANGYGYTISEESARKYCPPNWQHWYNTTSEQMNMI